MIWSSVETPATPSMSTEMKTRMPLIVSGSDHVVGLDAGRQPAAEVHTVDSAVGTAREVAAHALGRSLRDDVLVATRQQCEREWRLVLGDVFTGLAQRSSHFRLEVDLRQQP